MSWFLCGALVGPAVGPFLGGVIVTFRNWRIIFWLQAALGGAAVVLILFGFPETAHSKKMDELCTFPTRKEKVKKMLEWFNPSGVLGLARMPNLIFLVRRQMSSHHITHTPHTNLHLGSRNWRPTMEHVLPSGKPCPVSMYHPLYLALVQSG